MGSQPPRQSEKSEEVVVSKTPLEDKPSEPTKPAMQTPETVPASASPESTEGKKKPAGAVSLFGGIDVFANKQAKSPLDKADDDDSFPSKSSPPPIVKKEEKVKKNTVSLFDDEEEDDSDWNEPIFVPSKPTDKNPATVCMSSLLCILYLLQPWYMCLCVHLFIFFYLFNSLLRRNNKQRAQVCFRMRSCCSASRSKRTTTQMWTSFLPRGKLQSV